MKNLWHLTNYYFKVFFSWKVMLVVVVFALAFFSLAGSKVLDTRADQFDLNHQSLVNSYLNLSYMIMPIFLAFALNTVIGAKFAATYKTSEDYACLVGGGTRYTVFLGKALATALMVAVSFCLYFILVQVAALVSGLAVFNSAIVGSYFTILLNLFVVAAWTVFLAIVFRSSFSPLLVSLFYAFAIIVNNDAPAQPSGVLVLLQKVFNVILPLSSYEITTTVPMTQYVPNARPAYGLSGALASIFLLAVLSCGVYLRQDL